ncbi:MAG TPA: VOC family protein [Verrucomicrobiae bacterium]|nr:VOC family protein [Verrucomicrobiae bacterium]
MDPEITFTGGVNIALKIPKYCYEDTVAFYRDTLKLEVKEEAIDNPTVSRTHSVVFGPNTVWLDCVDNYTHSEAWLEIQTPDVAKATDYLRTRGVTTKDEFEQIPADKHWITDPAGTVMIVSAPERAGAY